MRIVPYMPLFTTMHDDVRAVLHRGRQLLAVHQETAVAGEGDDQCAPGCELGGDRRRHAIAHGAVGRRELRAEAAKLIEAMRPGRVVARAIGDDRIGRQSLAQPCMISPICAAPGWLLRSQMREIVRVRRLAQAARAVLDPLPAHAPSAAKAAIPLLIGSVGLVYAPQLFGSEMHVHQLLARHAGRP